ncbi:MAG: N4-gp56 family major capsid protein [Oscillospiraceae bacterium]|nr:N4-gp56 family major capsid protein [Oscillospiraceae bacterium]
MSNTQTTHLTAENNNLSAEMKTFYDMALIDEATPNLVYDQFGQKRPIPAGKGKTIEFRKFSSLPKALKPITEGVTPDGNKLNVTAVSATVEQYGDYIEQSDMLELTAIDNTIVEATKMLGNQAGRTLDTIVRNEVVGGTNVIYGALEGKRANHRYEITAEHKITVDDIFDAAAELKGNNAPKIDGSYVAIVHPHVARDLMVSSKEQGSWIDINKYADPTNIFEGEIGKIGGVRFVESTEAKIFSSKPLSEEAVNLTVKTAVNSANSVTVNEKVTEEIIGRKLLIGSVQTEVIGLSGTTLTLEDKVTAASGDTIYPGEAGKDGAAVYATMVLGANAYGVTEITGGGLQHIVKQLGSGSDPLNQRSSVGWKATKAAKRLVEENMVRIETGSYKSALVEGN